jgi:hypothetical protein
MIPTLISVIQVELCRIRIVHVRFDLNPKGYVARVSALDAIIAKVSGLQNPCPPTLQYCNFGICKDYAFSGFVLFRGFHDLTYSVPDAILPRALSQAPHFRAGLCPAIRYSRFCHPMTRLTKRLLRSGVREPYVDFRGSAITPAPILYPWQNHPSRPRPETVKR